MVLSTEEKREHTRKRAKKYRDANKEKIKKWQKKYIATKPAWLPKQSTIHNWVQTGVKCDDFDKLYETYINQKYCEKCKCEFGVKGDGTNRWRCLSLGVIQCHSCV
tara:strand:- start:3517 stop:3834 length:318 start_codon:yes stop_codon:yes gene_type:complete